MEATHSHCLDGRSEMLQVEERKQAPISLQLEKMSCPQWKWTAFISDEDRREGLNSLGFAVAQMATNLYAMQETQVWSLGWKDPLEKGMATHSRILAWRIPWTEEPGGLQPMALQESDVTEWPTLLNH